MKHLDFQVVEQALEWLRSGQTIWFCTVLSTFGSSPREPGSIMVARSDGQHLGSLSGGCVEDDFLDRLRAGQFSRSVSIERYGEPGDQGQPQIQLPCGGILEVLVERLEASAANTQHMAQLLAIMHGQAQMQRVVCLQSGTRELLAVDSSGGARVELTPELHPNTARIRIGPALRLIIAGLSSVASACAEFAVALGYEVIVCEPRPEVYDEFDLDQVRLEKMHPVRFIEQAGHCHQQTAIVAMTHDPRIDDLAMMEAVHTDAFYIGVMGSRRTSDKRASRLMEIGGLSPKQVERIQMPIGLALGSKTPAEIALAVMADILRVQKGIARNNL